MSSIIDETIVTYIVTYYEISHDRLADAIREEHRWRLPRGVKIGLAMIVAVVVGLPSIPILQQKMKDVYRPPLLKNGLPP